MTHLITHTAGLPPLPADFYLRPARLAHQPLRPLPPAAHVVAAFARHRPRHRPGTRWRYSNFGSPVLGHALAAALQTPWGHPPRRGGAAPARPERHRPHGHRTGHGRPRSPPRRHPRARARRGRLPCRGRRPGHPGRPGSPCWRPTSTRRPARPWPTPCARCAGRCCGAESGTGTCTPSPGSGTPPTTARCTSTPAPPWASRPSSDSAPARAPRWRPSAPAAITAATPSSPPAYALLADALVNGGIPDGRPSGRSRPGPVEGPRPGVVRAQTFCHSAGVAAGCHAPWAWCGWRQT
ncbi:serine hydrolase [Streptomyces sp. PG2]